MQADSGYAARKIRILVADNSRIHSQLLSEALQRDSGLSVVAWDWNPLNLIPSILTDNIDVLAISSTLSGQAVDGLHVVQELRVAHPRTKVVVLLDSQDDELVLNAFRAGARGVFSRESSVEMLCKCIHSVCRGEIWADTREVSLAVNALAATPVIRAMDSQGLNLLSKRELQVVQFVVQGLTNREIADRLGLSQHTIKNYLFRVFDKLGVSSRVELLFMTLTQQGTRKATISADVPNPAGPKKIAESNPQNEPILAFFERTAENGGPAAQLALAQAYWERRANPSDLVQAYMWYLIATERALTSRANLARLLSSQQIEEAQQKAGQWFARKNEPRRAKDESNVVDFKQPQSVTRQDQGQRLAEGFQSK